MKKYSRKLQKEDIKERNKKLEDIKNKILILSMDYYIIYNQPIRKVGSIISDQNIVFQNTEEFIETKNIIDKLDDLIKKNK